MSERARPRLSTYGTPDNLAAYAFYDNSTMSSIIETPTPANNAGRGVPRGVGAGFTHDNGRPHSAESGLSSSYHSEEESARPSSQYFRNPSPRIPEYALPSPPIPAAFEDEYGDDDDVCSAVDKHVMRNSTKASASAGGGKMPQSRSANTLASAPSYLDEQLRDLYVDGYYFDEKK